MISVISVVNLLFSEVSVSEPSWLRDGEGDQTLEENWLFRLRRERYRSRASGRAHDFYVMHLADAVNVIALTPDLELVLVRQFRAGSGRDSLETPGGLLNPGEDPLEAGARELLEETGYAGDPPICLGTCWSNPSIMSSRITTILIPNVRPMGETKPDPNEELAIELVPARRIPKLLASRQIDHALVVQGLLLWLVSQIPSQPLALQTLDEPGWLRFSIATVMVWVALSALLFATVANAGRTLGLLLALAFALPMAGIVVNKYFDIRDDSILGWDRCRSPRRKLLRRLATLGLAALLWLLIVALFWLL